MEKMERPDLSLIKPMLPLTAHIGLLTGLMKSYKGVVYVDL